MMDSTSNAPELDQSDVLRSPQNIDEADARTHAFPTVDHSAGTMRPQTHEDRFHRVAQFRLSNLAPKAVRIHFETAKNLYLYAWFVYRFHPVSEQQALATLEFALRDRLKIEKKNSSLSRLLKQALREGVISNSALTCREQWARRLAEERHLVRVREEMMRCGLVEMEFTYADVEVTRADIEHDWIGDLVCELPTIRNEYAHGSGRLNPTVLHTFRVVCDLINYMYRK